MSAAKTPDTPLIVADVGGTHARFALANDTGAVSDISRYRDAEFNGFDAALSAYLATLGDPAPKSIAVGAAGPLNGSAIRLTNAPWVIDAGEVRRRGLRMRALANDLVADAAGVAFATPEQLVQLAGPHAARDRRTLVIAIGTGIGVAWFERDGDGVGVHSTEAGHLGFAPASEDEADLLRRLIAAGRRHSVESIASGSGLPQLYAALSDAPKDAPLLSTDQIVAGAESGQDKTAQAAVAFAMGALATLARDLVLALAGVDAIVFGGGLGRRLRAHLAGDAFMARLAAPTDSPIDMSRLAVKLITDDTVSLSGIAHLAQGRATCRDLYCDA
jgi:glucokinase